MLEGLTGFKGRGGSIRTATAVMHAVWRGLMHHPLVVLVVRAYSLGEGMRAEMMVLTQLLLLHAAALGINHQVDRCSERCSVAVSFRWVSAPLLQSGNCPKHQDVPAPC